MSEQEGHENVSMPAEGVIPTTGPADIKKTEVIESVEKALASNPENPVEALAKATENPEEVSEMTEGHFREEQQPGKEAPEAPGNVPAVIDIKRQGVPEGAHPVSSTTPETVYENIPGYEKLSKEQQSATKELFKKTQEENPGAKTWEEVAGIIRENAVAGEQGKPEEKPREASIAVQNVPAVGPHEGVPPPPAPISEQAAPTPAAIEVAPAPVLPTGKVGEEVQSTSAEEKQAQTPISEEEKSKKEEELATIRVAAESNRPQKGPLANWLHNAKDWYAGKTDKAAITEARTRAFDLIRYAWERRDNKEFWKSGDGAVVLRGIRTDLWNYTKLSLQKFALKDYPLIGIGALIALFLGATFLIHKLSGGK